MRLEACSKYIFATKIPQVLFALLKLALKCHTKLSTILYNITQHSIQIKALKINKMILITKNWDALTLHTKTELLAG